MCAAVAGNGEEPATGEDKQRFCEDEIHCAAGEPKQKSLVAYLRQAQVTN